MKLLLVIIKLQQLMQYMPEGIECEEPPEYCDTLLVYVQVLDTLIIQLPPDTLTIFEVDTLIVFQVDTLIEYVTLPPDTVFVPWEYYYYDTIYVDVIDTLYISLVDTVIVTVTELEWVYVTDTVFINTTDTLYITQVDTVMQEVLVYEYIFQTDTIYDIVYSEILIDCASGLPCGDGAIGDDCNSVFVPNAFSPNNDGINDSFYAASNSYLCWLDWHILVYNRWGEVVWQSTDPESQWYGEAQSGSHYVSDGVYIWTLRAKGVEGNVLDLQGHLTLFR